jgi:SEC-C motif
MSFEARFVPTSADVEHYKHLRRLAKDLNHKIVKTVPREAMQEIGDALGILRNGTLVFETEHEPDILMDCCLYDWIRDGKNVVERFAEDHPPMPETEEGELLQAYLRAQYRILMPQSCVKGAGVHVVDLLAPEELFLMDVGISESPLGIAYATRTIPLREYWITGGAGLPTGQEGITRALNRLRKKRLLVNGRFSDPHQATLAFVRTLLEEGVSQNITYEDPVGAASRQLRGSLARTNAPTQAPPPPSGPSRNSSCPCGSGKRYKRCCGS